MKTKTVLLFFVSLSLFAFSQRYIYPDDIYYDKNDEKKELSKGESPQKTEILIAEPEVESYQEGVIIYKNEDGTGDTIYIYDQSDYYFDKLTPKTNTKPIK